MKNQKTLINAGLTQSGKPARSKSGWKKLSSDQWTPSGKTMTIQDQSYTIKDLLKKHALGMMPNTNLYETYDENPDHDDHDFARAIMQDIAERQQTITDLADKVKRTQDKIKSALAQPLAESKVDTKTNPGQTTNN